MRDSRPAQPGIISVARRAAVQQDRPSEEQAMTKALGDPHSEANTLTNLGLVLAEQGHWDQATTHWHAALSILERLT
jgi:cytochrome c-type biogenesis protein CcmH/NrfG